MTLNVLVKLPLSTLVLNHISGGCVVVVDVLVDVDVVVDVVVVDVDVVVDVVVVGAAVVVVP